MKKLDKTQLIIYIIALGDVVTVLRTKEVSGEVWVQLDIETAEKHCFATDDGDAWSLAYSNTGKFVIFNKFQLFLSYFSELFFYFSSL